MRTEFLLLLKAANNAKLAFFATSLNLPASPEGEACVEACEALDRAIDQAKDWLAKNPPKGRWD